MCDLYVRLLKTCWNSITLILKTGRFTLDLSSTWTLGLLLQWWVLTPIMTFSGWLFSKLLLNAKRKEKKLSSGMKCLYCEICFCVQGIHMSGSYATLCIWIGFCWCWKCLLCLGVGGSECCQDWKSDARRDQPCRLQTRNHQRRFLYWSGQVSVLWNATSNIIQWCVVMIKGT